MHRYTPRWSETDSERDVPSRDGRTFRDAHDFIEYAADDRLTTWYTYPWMWHLDESGRARCFSKGSSLCDVQLFAQEPERVVECRMVGTDCACPPYWLMIESRQSWRTRGADVTEADAAAFLDLRRTLATYGISLLDDIVVDEQFHWWSLHELTAGTTVWDFTPPDRTLPMERARNRPPHRIRKGWPTTRRGGG
jgi:hypothetical protein